MTLLELLSFLAAVTGCAGMVVAGMDLAGGKLVVLWFLALVYGLACMVGQYKAVTWLLTRSRAGAPPLQAGPSALSWGLLMAAILWICLAGMLGFRLGALIVRF